MPSAKVSIAWGPGQQLITSSGEGPNCDINPLNSISRPLLSLFFQAHVEFELNKADAWRSSKGYRALLLDCIGSLVAEEVQLMESGDTEEANLASLSVDMVRDGHCVWQFAEAVYLADGFDDQHISVRLTHWYLDCFPVLKKKHRDMLAALQANAFTEKDFWDVVTQLVAVGARNMALEIIQARPHDDPNDTAQWADAAGAAAMRVISKPRSNSNASSLGTAESLLRECPQDVSAAHKDGRWDQWQSRCIEWSVAEEMSSDDRIRKLLGVLGGNIVSMAECCQNWQEMLVACTAYGKAKPGVAQSRLSSDVVNVACGDAGTVFSPPKHIAGGALTEAAMGNPGGMLICLGVSLSTTWFAAHLCDLLVQAGVISEEGPKEWTSANSELGIREFYLKEFAASLERHRGMWRVAAAYFVQCPTVGASLLSSMLSRMTFDGPGDPTVEKVLRLCGQKGWVNAARSICERLGSDCVESVNYGGALFWFARGSLRHRAHEVANDALLNAEMQGPGTEASRDLECVVSSLGTTKDDSLPQSLDYLRVYSEFQTAILKCTQIKAMEQQDVESYLEHRSFALSAILRLIGGGGLARKHWAVALREVADLVKTHSAQVPVVSIDVVQELLSALQLVSGSYRSPELLLGLQRRIFFEISGSTSEEEMQNAVDVKDVERSLHNVRKVFVSAVARAVLA